MFYTILVTILAFFIGVFTGYFCKETKDDPELTTKRISLLRKNKEIDPDLKKYPIYYINMDRTTKRKQNFEKEMKNYGISNYKRVSAIDGKMIKDREKGDINGVTYASNGKRLSSSELAITLSHIKAVIQASKDNNDNFIIMEDDCRLTLAPYWEKNIEEILKDIPEDCEIFLLSNRRHDHVKKLEIIKCPGRGDLNGVCYIVTRKGMEKVKDLSNGGKIDLTKFKNPVFDIEFLEYFTVYTYNKTFFLLDNFEHMSTHKNGSDKSSTTPKIHTVDVVQYNTFL